ncbi:MAG TPA: helix-turn-helix domain-containing protein [Pontiellaceae bacterium]|nr:helix-turn-helix domain-containing protein [Pontiellaceae bacterium]HPR82403.1 helix-turn-helix domain-containing protein [Pontiellaceae bacterium]
MKMDHQKHLSGFRGQILHVISRSILSLLESHKLVRDLRVTDIGWFPDAKNHSIRRPHGAGQHILILCVDGAGWVEGALRRETVSAGQAVLIPAGIPHAYGASPHAPWSVHWVHFDGEDAPLYLQRMPASSFCISVSAECVSAMVSVFCRCYDALAGGYADRNLLYLSHALRDLLGLLFYNNPAYSPDGKTGSGHNLENIMALMTQRIGQALTVPEMAQHAGMSVVHFSALFRRQTGLSPGDYFIHLRLKHACWLLETTALPIREIGFKTGYEDPYYFSRSFRKLMGLSPRQYRKMSKG